MNFTTKKRYLSVGICASIATAVAGLIALILTPIMREVAFANNAQAGHGFTQDAITKFSFVNYTPGGSGGGEGLPSLSSATGDSPLIWILLGVVVVAIISAIILAVRSKHKKAKIGSAMLSIVIVMLVGVFGVGQAAFANGALQPVSPEIEVRVNPNGGDLSFGDGDKSNITGFVNSSQDVVLIEKFAMNGDTSIGQWTATNTDNGKVLFSGGVGTEQTFETPIALEPGQKLSITWSTDQKSEDVAHLVGSVPASITYTFLQKNQMQATFDTNGGCYPDGSTQVTLDQKNGDKYNMPTQTPTFADFTFGDYADENGNVINAEAYVNTMENHTVYAQWTIPGITKQTANELVENYCTQANTTISNLENITGVERAQLISQNVDITINAKAEIESATTDPQLCNTVVTAYKQMLEVLKIALKSDLNGNTEKCNNAIVEMSDLTDADRAKFINQINSTCQEATTQIEKANAFDSAVSTEQNAVSGQINVALEAYELNTAKQEAKAVLDEQTQSTIDKIAEFTNLTEAQQQSYVDQANSACQTSKQVIADATDVEDVQTKYAAETEKLAIQFNELIKDAQSKDYSNLQKAKELANTTIVEEKTSSENFIDSLPKVPEIVKATYKTSLQNSADSTKSNINNCVEIDGEAGIVATTENGKANMLSICCYVGGVEIDANQELQNNQIDARGDVAQEDRELIKGAINRVCLVAKPKLALCTSLDELSQGVDETEATCSTFASALDDLDMFKQLLCSEFDYLQEQEYAKIDEYPNLLEEDINTFKAEIKTIADQAKSQINGSSTYLDAREAYNSYQEKLMQKSEDIATRADQKGQENLANKKTQGKAELTQLDESYKESITKSQTLTDVEKDALNADIDAIVNFGFDAIDQQQSLQGVDEVLAQVKTEALNKYIEAGARSISNNEIIKNGQIDAMSDLSDTDKSNAKAKISALTEQYITKVFAAKDADEVDSIVIEHNQKAQQEVDAAQLFNDQKQAAKQTIKDLGDPVKLQIGNNPNILDDQKQHFNDEVDYYTDTHIAVLDNTTTKEELDQALTEESTIIKLELENVVKESEILANDNINKAKPEGKENVSKNAQAATTSVNNLPDISQQTKDEYVQTIEQINKQAGNDIDTASTLDEVDTIVQKADKATLDELKNAAKDATGIKLQKYSAKVDDTPVAQEVKDIAKETLGVLCDDYNQDIDKAENNTKVEEIVTKCDTSMSDLCNAITDVNSAKKFTKDELQKLGDKEITLISVDKYPNLTQDDLDGFHAEVLDGVKAAQTEIDKQASCVDVFTEYNKQVDALSKKFTDIEASAKTKSDDNLTSAKSEKKQELKTSESSYESSIKELGLTDPEAEEYIAQLNNVLTQATANVDNAKNLDEVEDACSVAEEDYLKVYKEAVGTAYLAKGNTIVSSFAQYQDPDGVFSYKDIYESLANELYAVRDVLYADLENASTKQEVDTAAKDCQTSLDSIVAKYTEFGNAKQAGIDELVAMRDSALEEIGNLVNLPLDSSAEAKANIIGCYNSARATIIEAETIQQVPEKTQEAKDYLEPALKDIVDSAKNADWQILYSAKSEAYSILVDKFDESFDAITSMKNVSDDEKNKCKDRISSYYQQAKADVDKAISVSEIELITNTATDNFFTEYKTLGITNIIAYKSNYLNMLDELPNVSSEEKAPYIATVQELASKYEPAFSDVATVADGVDVTSQYEDVLNDAISDVVALNSMRQAGHNSIEAGSNGGKSDIESLNNLSDEKKNEYYGQIDKLKQTYDEQINQSKTKVQIDALVAAFTDEMQEIVDKAKDEDLHTKIGYAVYEFENGAGKLTFYYDALYSQRAESLTCYKVPSDSGASVEPGWLDKKDFIGSVKFDSSCKDQYQPTTTYSWFAGFGQYVRYDFTNLDVHKVKNMSKMFAGAQMESLNISSFMFGDELTNTSQMFDGCSNLSYVLCDTNLNKFESLTSSTDMFNGTKLPHRIEGIATDKTYAYPDNGETGFFSPTNPTYQLTGEHVTYTINGQEVTDVSASYGSTTYVQIDPAPGYNIESVKYNNGEDVPKNEDDKYVINHKFNGTITATTKVSIATVSYDLNGGSGTTPDPQTVTIGGSVILPEAGDITASDGKNDFCGWNTKADFTGTRYLPGAEYQVNEDITLYAQYTNYLTFSTLHKSVNFNYSGSANIVEYKIGNSEWKTISTLFDVPEYSYVLLRHKSGAEKYPAAYTYINPSDYICGSGSMTSVIDGIGSDPNIQMDDYMFEGLFNGAQSRLLSAPDLVALNLSKGCYKSMFDGCNCLASPAKMGINGSGIISAAAESCYHMYSACNSICLTDTKTTEADKQILLVQEGAELEDNWSEGMFDQTPSQGVEIASGKILYYNTKLLTFSPDDAAHMSVKPSSLEVPSNANNARYENYGGGTLGIVYSMYSGDSLQTAINVDVAEGYSFDYWSVDGEEATYGEILKDTEFVAHSKKLPEKVTVTAGVQGESGVHGTINGLAAEGAKVSVGSEYAIDKDKVTITDSATGAKTTFNYVRNAAPTEGDDHTYFVDNWTNGKDGAALGTSGTITENTNFFANTAEAYVYVTVNADNDNLLHFAFDNDRTAQGFTTYPLNRLSTEASAKTTSTTPGWRKSNAVSIQINNDFAKYKPETIALWFAQMYSQPATNLDILDTSLCQDMTATFFGSACKLEGSDEYKISGWDTSNVKYMDNMFFYGKDAPDGRKTIQPLDLSSWKLNNLSSAKNMFASYGVSSNTFPIVYGGNWSSLYSSVTGTGMFDKSSLIGSGTTFAEGACNHSSTSPQGRFTNKVETTYSAVFQTLTNSSTEGVFQLDGKTIAGNELFGRTNLDKYTCADATSGGLAIWFDMGAEPIKGTHEVTFVPNDGYELEGWQIDGVDATQGTTGQIDHSVKFVAKTKKTKVNITFNPNGGTFNGSPDPLVYSFNMGTSLSEASNWLKANGEWPVKNFIDAVYWNTDSTSKLPQDFEVNEDTTVYAVYLDDFYFAGGLTSWGFEQFTYDESNLVFSWTSTEKASTNSEFKIMCQQDWAGFLIHPKDATDIAFANGVAKDVEGQVMNKANLKLDESFDGHKVKFTVKVDQNGAKLTAEVADSTEEILLGDNDGNGWEFTKLGQENYMLSDGGTELIKAGAQVGDVVNFYLVPPSNTWDCIIREGHYSQDYKNISWPEPHDETYEIYDLDAHGGKYGLVLTDDILTAATTQQWWGGTFLLNTSAMKCTKITLAKQSASANFVSAGYADDVSSDVAASADGSVQHSDDSAEVVDAPSSTTDNPAEDANTPDQSTNGDEAEESSQDAATEEADNGLTAILRSFSLFNIFALI